MNLYETPVSRVASGIAAVAMTAITIGVAVVIPAKVESGSTEPLTVTTSKATSPAVTDLGTINVVGVREPRLSAVPCASPHRKPNPDRQSTSCSPAAT